MNLISSNDLAFANEAMTNLFDSFKRSGQVRFYKIQNEAVISTNSDYMADFYEMQGIASGVSGAAQYQDFDARVWFLNRVESPTFVGGGDDMQIRARQLYGKIRMQVTSGAYDYMKDTERFVYNDTTYQIDEKWRGVGIFGDLNYYSIILSAII